MLLFRILLDSYSLLCVRYISGLIAYLFLAKHVCHALCQYLAYWLYSNFMLLHSCFVLISFSWIFLLSNDLCFLVPQRRVMSIPLSVCMYIYIYCTPFEQYLLPSLFLSSVSWLFSKACKRYSTICLYMNRGNHKPHRLWKKIGSPGKCR